MKPLISAAIASTSTVATGLLLVIVAGEVAVAMAAQSQISAQTPIGGLTIGAVIAGVVAGLGFLWWGGKQLLVLGGYLAALRAALDDGRRYAETLQQVSRQVEKNQAAVAKNTEALAALERWRSVVGPTVQEHEIRLRGRSDRESSA